MILDNVLYLSSQDLVHDIPIDEVSLMDVSDAVWDMVQRVSLIIFVDGDNYKILKSRYF